MQGFHKPSICKNAICAKYNKMNHNKARYFYMIPEGRNIILHCMLGANVYRSDSYVFIFYRC